MALTNLGMIGIKSVHGAYLQAHQDNGEMHASNMSRNTEETWFLIEVDVSSHFYALYNYSNGNFISKRTNGCAPAISTVLSDSETWVLVSGVPFGILNGVAIKNKADGTFLGTDDGGGCGGEVAARDTEGLGSSSGWAGWWVIETATAPTEGKDFWNSFGGFVSGIANKITPANIVALFEALAS